MVIFSGLFTGFARLIGAVATMAIAWATSLEFGRIPRARSSLISFIALGSLVWVGAILGLLIPTVWGLILAAIPHTPFAGPGLIRWIALVLALFLPLAIGVATVRFTDDADPPGASGRAVQVLRGYPVTAAYAGTIVYLAAWGLARRIRALRHGWVSEHIPIITKPGHVDDVVTDLTSALRGVGFEVVPAKGSWWSGLPLRLMGAVSGAGARALIPHEPVTLETDDLSIVVYPFDVALLGRVELVSRARAAIADRLTYADVYLTFVREWQDIEDRLRGISRQGTVSAADFGAVDALLDTLDAPYDEWATLVRLRLQVEHEWRGADIRQPVGVI